MFFGGGGAGGAFGFGFVPYLITSGSARYVEYHVWSYSSFPSELKTRRRTLVEREGDPDSSTTF